MDYKSLKDLFYQHECDYPKTHLTGYITFASFGPDNKKEYPWSSRTYIVSSDNKAFQPNKGGYSIFGSCLDGSDPCVRLEEHMAEEYGGKDGWAVEDCCIAGYLLIECSGCNISAPVMFYTRSAAERHMLSQLAEKGGYDAEQLNNEYSTNGQLFKEDKYEVGRDHAWLATTCEDWLWKIQPAYIYSPFKMMFPEMSSSMVIKEHGTQKSGICPLCGSELEYGEDIPLDDGGVYEWTCPACGATGKEGYDKVFDRHYNVCDGDGNPASPPIR